MSAEQRRQSRQALSKPLWDELEVWLKLQRRRVLDGSKIAEAIDYSLDRLSERLAGSGAATASSIWMSMATGDTDDDVTVVMLRRH